MTSIAELNQLQCSSAGVFQAEQSTPFNYSDGQQTEQQLEQILRAAQDLSSASAELEAQICDWPTEYHLSRARANLLRPLNLQGMQRVLELGCGCGSISRYLGEQANLQVDAVEGSQVRAELAALRCRDQQNVTVHCGNFNAFEFPEQSYDLVLFVGVTEYAGRFSARETDQDAVLDLLALARRALKPGGVILIAIENRLGLKYLLGACEDHYGIPAVGIADYPESTGIRTYDYAQWQGLIQQSGVAAARFCYPFPDYKVPSVLIHEQAQSSSAANDALQDIRSRDYLKPFSTTADEGQLWSGVLQAGALPTLANSFLIIIGDDANAVDRVADFSVDVHSAPSYDWHTPVAGELSRGTEGNAAPVAVQDHNRQPVSQRAPQHSNSARQVIAQLQEANQALSERLALIENSRGWRSLRYLRRLLGKPNP